MFDCVLNTPLHTVLSDIGDLVFYLLAICGVHFPDDKEAAFSQFKLWQATGCIISFSCGNYMCTDIKIYILVGFLITGIFGYILAQISQRRNNTFLEVSTSKEQQNNSVELHLMNFECKKNVLDEHCQIINTWGKWREKMRQWGKMRHWTRKIFSPWIKEWFFNCRTLAGTNRLNTETKNKCFF